MGSWGINRNILECKDDIRNHRGTGHNRINRNILECKDRCSRQMLALVLVY